MTSYDDLNKMLHPTVEKINATNDWRVTNDSVMGGISSGNVQHQGNRFFSLVTFQLKITAVLAVFIKVRVV